MDNPEPPCSQETTLQQAQLLKLITQQMIKIKKHGYINHHLFLLHNHLPLLIKPSLPANSYLWQPKFFEKSSC